MVSGQIDQLFLGFLFFWDNLSVLNISGNQERVNNRLLYYYIFVILHNYTVNTTYMYCIHVYSVQLISILCRQFFMKLCQYKKIRAK